MSPVAAAATLQRAAEASADSLLPQLHADPVLRGKASRGTRLIASPFLEDARSTPNELRPSLSGRGRRAPDKGAAKNSRCPRLFLSALLEQFSEWRRRPAGGFFCGPFARGWSMPYASGTVR